MSESMARREQDYLLEIAGRAAEDAYNAFALANPDATIWEVGAHADAVFAATYARARKNFRPGFLRGVARLAEVG